MIKVENFNKKYEKSVFSKNLNLTFEDSGFYFIVGESGSGKTTLLNILALLDSKFDGELYYDKLNIKSAPQNHIEFLKTNKISYLTQDLNLIETETVYYNLKILLELFNEKNSENKIDEILKFVGLKNYKNRYINELSKGEKQRIAISRALLKKTNIFIFDEPTSSLDNENAVIIFDLLKKIAERHLIIVSSHDRNLMENYADYCISLEDDFFIKEKSKIEANSNSAYLVKDKKSIKFYFKYAFMSWKRNLVNYFIYIILMFILLFVISSDYQQICYPKYEKTYEQMMLKEDSTLFYENDIEEDEKEELSSLENSYFFDKVSLNIRDIEYIFEITDDFIAKSKAKLIGNLPTNFKEVVITKDLAKKLFFNQAEISSVLGKKLIISDNEFYIISGLLAFEHIPIEYRSNFDNVLFGKKKFLNYFYENRIYSGLNSNISFETLSGEFDFEGNEIMDYYDLMYKNYSTKIPSKVLFFKDDKTLLKDNEIIIDINKVRGLSLLKENIYEKEEELIKKFANENFTEEIKKEIRVFYKKEDVNIEDYIRFIKNNPEYPYNHTYFKSLAYFENLDPRKIENIKKTIVKIKNDNGGFFEEMPLKIVGVFISENQTAECIISPAYLTNLKKLAMEEDRQFFKFCYILEEGNYDQFLSVAKKYNLGLKNFTYQEITSSINRLSGRVKSEQIVVYLICFLIINSIYFNYSLFIKKKTILVLRNNGVRKKEFLWIFLIEHGFISLFVFISGIFICFAGNKRSYKRFKLEEIEFYNLYNMDFSVFLVLFLILLTSMIVGLIILNFYLNKKLITENKVIN